MLYGGKRKIEKNIFLFFKMKYIIKNLCYIVILLLVVSSCKKISKEEAVQRMIHVYLQNDSVVNYKSVQFSGLDSTFTSVKKTPEYQHFYLIEGLSTLLMHTYKYEDPEKSKIYEDSMKIYKNKCDSLEALFVPEFIGWKMQHIYQSEDKEKGIVVNNFIFYFNKDMSQIVEKEQVYRNLLLKTFEQDQKLYGIKK